MLNEKPEAWFENMIREVGWEPDRSQILTIEESLDKMKKKKKKKKVCPKLKKIWKKLQKEAVPTRKIIDFYHCPKCGGRVRFAGSSVFEEKEDGFVEVPVLYCIVCGFEAPLSEFKQVKWVRLELVKKLLLGEKSES